MWAHTCNHETVLSAVRCSLREGLNAVLPAYTIASQLQACALVIDAHGCRVACMAHRFFQHWHGTKQLWGLS